MGTSAKPARTFFDAGELRVNASEESLEGRIARAIRYMALQHTWDEEEINRAIRLDGARELSRVEAAKALDYLDAQGIDIRQGRMMDLGAGLGMVSEEAAARGASPFAVEPGGGFREIALTRIRRAGDGSVVAAVGESLPFPDNSFDVVVCMEVLEHTDDPPAVLAEVWRILKPGGWCYLTCPNYLSFREGHYDIVWFPLLPKSLGALYLRLRGRRPDFLMTSITYTTLPGVRREIRKLRFKSAREMYASRKCDSPQLIKNPWMRAAITTARKALSTDAVVRILDWIDTTHCLFSLGLTELIQKPLQTTEQNRKC